MLGKERVVSGETDRLQIDSYKVRFLTFSFIINLFRGAD